MNVSKPHNEILAVLQRVSRQEPSVLINDPVAVASVTAYPAPATTTLVTVGLSDHLYTLYRGKKSGFELTLTVSDNLLSEWAEDLSRAAGESIRLSKSGERRPHIEYNGVYAPGYVPHFFFCDELSQTPQLSGRQKAGDRYVRWLAAIPITDAELRIYDKDPKQLIKTLRRASDLSEWTQR